MQKYLSLISLRFFHPRTIYTNLIKEYTDQQENKLLIYEIKIAAKERDYDDDLKRTLKNKE